MNRVLITGMGGFLGSHLAEFLRAKGHAVAGTVHRDSSRLGFVGEAVTVLPCDILDAGQVQAAVRAARPEMVFHFAAQSLPVLSWRDPESTFRVNVFGTMHLLEAVRGAGLDPVIVVAGSSAEYGAPKGNMSKISERAAVRPASPYGASKATADLLARFYAQAFRMKVLRVRPFLAIGPRKVGDMCSDFARGIVAVERGLQPALRVGSLEPVRDFLDVRDVVGACSLIAERGKPGRAYNVCSGVGYSVRQVLDILLSKAVRTIPVEPDPALMRPNDQPVVIGDNSRLRALGWEPTVPLEQSLAEILDYQRKIAAPRLDGAAPGAPQRARAAVPEVGR